jgi:hypothetical protein
LPDSETPSYRKRCEGMDFGELAGFIEHSLERLSADGPDPGLPRHKEDFLDLARLLDAKNPAPSEPPPQSVYRASEALRAKRAKLERLRLRRLRAHGDPATKKRDLDQMWHRLLELEQEIDEQEGNEEEEHEQRLLAYRGAHAPHEARSRTARAVRRSIERAFGSLADVPTIHLTWPLAPPGSAAGDALRRTYGDLQRQGRLAGFDRDRLEKLIRLRPKLRYEGTGGFEGYSIFTFDYTPRALMECFIRGNAIFVLDADPGSWPKENKQELRADPSVTWIAHRGDWFDKVRRELGVPNDVAGTDTEPPA